MAHIMIGVFLCTLVGAITSNDPENDNCLSNYLSLFHVITDERTQRLLGNADIETKFKNLENQNTILEEKLKNITLENTSGHLVESGDKAKLRALENKFNMLQEKLNSVMAEPRADNKQVAFSGRLSRKFPKSEFGQTVKFDVVTTNIGSAYDTATGIFRCPVSGLYLISLSVLGDKNSFVVLEVLQNGTQIARPHSGYGGYGYKSGTDTSVIHANKGDEISSKVISGSAAYLDHYSRFTAVLLKTD